MSRGATILDRFPRHLALDEAGKLFRVVVDGLSNDLDVQTSQLRQVRIARRLREAEQEHDLLLLAGFHGYDDDLLDVLRRRRDVLVTTADAVKAAGGAADADLTLVASTTGTEADAFTPFPDEGADLTGARARLETALREAARYTPWLDLVRASVGAQIALARANGTVDGLLGGAATALGLEVTHVEHEPDGYWHLATCRDRVSLVRPHAPGDPAGVDVLAATDLVALEENPFQFHDVEPVPKHHGDRMRIVRGGFDAVPVAVIVRGTEDRTLEPMVVNLDTGFGVSTTVSVPDGQDLRFERDGRVTLSGASVARLSYTFEGAVFADASATHPRDFVYADAPALPTEPDAEVPDGTSVYSVTHPLTDAFDPSPSFPHGDPILLTATIERGESRWAFFVRAGHFGGATGTGDPVDAAPRPFAGVFDHSVFDPDPTGAPSGAVGFEWEEHEPFAVKVWLPMRFSTLDADGVEAVRERVRLLLDRHRAAGVYVSVDYADPRWTLGRGVVRDLTTTEAVGVVVSGTTVDDLPPPPT